MGLHTREAEWRDDDYFGPVVNRAARLMAIGNGGQVLCSAATAELVSDTQLNVTDLGEHRLRDLDLPMHVFQVGEGSFPALRSLDRLPGNLPELAGAFGDWVWLVELAPVGDPDAVADAVAGAGHGAGRAARGVAVGRAGRRGQGHRRRHPGYRPRSRQPLVSRPRPLRVGAGLRPG
jgi:hypothetical protein